MMEHEIASPRGAKRRRRRVGRGDASGHGSYSGRGMKGQKSRAGYSRRAGFEGGQIPLVKGLPAKRGFTNIFRKQFYLVKVVHLESFPEGTEVTPQTLVQAGILKNLKYPVKVLGNGEIHKPLTVSAHKFTRSALQKIEAAGGQVRQL